MKRPRLRALVLTAGLGTRLKPLTLFLPKPLLPLWGEPVVGHTLRQLARGGCEAVVLNLHHLADAIPAALGCSYYGLPLRYSREEEIQGTLGALFPQREFLAAADLLLLVNGDTVCSWPWQAMIRRHLRTGAAATLLLHRRAPEAALGGGVGVDARGFVVQLRDGAASGEVVRRHLFAGAHVLSPRLLERLEQGPADIIADLYQPLLRQGGKIATVTFSRSWHDLGTPERYLEASLDRPRRWLPSLCRNDSPRAAVSPLARIGDGTAVARSFVEPGAVVEKGCRLEGSIVMAGARVAAASEIRYSIIGPEVKLPPAANLERRMVNRVKVGYRPHPQESVLGELIYTPLALG